MADATAATGLGSIVPKPKASWLEEYERQMATRTNAAPTAFQQNYDTAAGRLASIASGTPSAGVQAAQQASREALARQAGNLRATTASATAASGQLGQGAGVRAAAANEQNIMKGIADSRLAERQAISQEASDANQLLITGAQADRSFDFQKQNQQQVILQSLLQSGTAAQQLEAQVGLQALSGIKPSARTDEINEAAYQEAIQDPKYQADQTAAKLALMESNTALKGKEEAVKRDELLRSAKGNVEDWVTSKAARKRIIGDVKEGDIVRYDGKPYIYEGRQLIGKEGFGGFLGGNMMDFSVDLYQIVLRDPITNEQVILRDRKRG